MWRSGKTHRCQCAHCFWLNEFCLVLQRSNKYQRVSSGTILPSLFSCQSFHEVLKPVGENVPWPLPRTFHPLCTLVDPDSVWGEGEGEGDAKQSIFLLWGRDTKKTVAEEAGFFTLDKDLKVSWTEVRLWRCQRDQRTRLRRCTTACMHGWKNMKS